MSRFPRDRFVENVEDYLVLPDGVNFSTGRKLLQKRLAAHTKRRIIGRKVGKGIVRYYADYHQKRNPWALWLEARREPFGEVLVRYTRRADESLPSDFVLDAEDTLYEQVETNKSFFKYDK